MQIVRSNKQLSTKMLIMYMVGALLFLTSIELHIHTQDAADLAEHGSAVSISGLSPDSLQPGAGDEIQVSPDGVLKVNVGSIVMLAILLLVTLLAIASCRSCVARLRDIHCCLPDLSSYDTPPLRAPPQ